ncbi:MAG: acyl-CoA ligase (AMP-forming), exosortase A system-associated [Sphingomonadaceae bacterium]|uniref:acyl-CoA ligase (AMP-forming), exosortase A system-associated n=1 Tax=Thermaurantiacus sp. TaxID=2820283 RepID=UPI00298F03F8|nr:acyl-CoA ligase (AMP-forming), exosortase A system-associated [Thermaurantiacus sp.]MCS6986460.1 acyl-CoA ligase (AMP-forming), exosortase A system-associated [Sphingomonadaceae bacterium]MDW8414279.1 acyl-CoA ligase (AMP-forming), exosortase A system-associated [Thermaurantiacus sp.]
MTRVDELLKRGAPEAIALVDRDRTLTYAALDASVDRVAAGLARRIAPGDRVAVWLPKSVEAVVALFAVARAGGIAVPVNPLLKGAQVGHILSDSGAALLLTHEPRRKLLEHPTCPVLSVERDWASLHDDGPPPAEAPGDDALAALLYTSGSTGRPKGVMVTHTNLLVGARSVASYLGTDPTDRVLAVLPLSFDFGLSQLTTAFHAGASAILLEYLLPRDVPAAVARHGATQLALVPPLWAQMVELDWPRPNTLRTLSASGGRMPLPVVRALRRLFPQARLHLMYGLTEAFRSTTLPPELVDRHPDSIGRAIPDAEVRVVRPDGTETAPGEPGELVHGGPLVTRGYWRDPERTAERFRPAPPAMRWRGLAVWSGDTVVRDEQGLLYFVGRTDEMIKTMGTRVSPTEIEEVALASGLVGAAVALGIPDPTLGARIRLVVVPRRAPDALEDALLRHFRRTAPAYMLPADIRVVAELPLGPNGKIDRTRVRADHGA